MKEYLLKDDVLRKMGRLYGFYDSGGHTDSADAIADAEEILRQLCTYRLRDVQVIAHGQWLPNDNRDAPTYDRGLMIRYFHCSVCNGDISDRYGKYRYCPHCGARMED